MSDEEDPGRKAAAEILFGLRTLTKMDMEDIEELELETIPQGLIESMSKTAIVTLSKEPVLLEVEGDVIIVGDLHGQLPDLVRIIQRFGLPPNNRYLFLGDTIDRGNFSVETVSYILSMKILWPGSVYFIRGNHEFESTCEVGGFLDEIKDLYRSEDVFHVLVDVFKYLPLAAKLNGDILCVHGGIGPRFHSLEQLQNVARPLNELYGGVANAILWSDPDASVVEFQPSERGSGCKFGLQAVSTFLETNKLRVLVRGHSYTSKGIEKSLNDKVITVFSASNYCGSCMNESGVLCICKGKPEEPVMFQPLKAVRRLKKRVMNFASTLGAIVHHRRASFRATRQQEVVNVKAARVGVPKFNSFMKGLK